VKVVARTGAETIAVNEKSWCCSLSLKSAVTTRKDQGICILGAVNMEVILERSEVDRQAPLGLGTKPQKPKLFHCWDAERKHLVQTRTSANALLKRHVYRLAVVPVPPV